MDRARTQGHRTAVAAVDAMIRAPAGPPHAVLLTGPGGVGKTTLALDLAAGLLCQAQDRAERPCRACRACRMVDATGHPDLHLLAPDGAGGQIGIGGRDARAPGVRDLIADLALMAMEGGSRVAVISEAHRLNEDAQGALLKTLEEPPQGVTIVLCADDEDRILPTIRSRCARLRLGRVGSRDIESILSAEGVSDPALAGRLARLSAGRPGVALVLARAPEAVIARTQLARILIDLVPASPAIRLAAVRDAIPTALDMADALDATAAQGGSPVRASTAARGSRNGRRAKAPQADAATDADDAGDTRSRSIPPVRRRQAAEALIGVWADVTRDLALLATDDPRLVRDPDLLEEAGSIARTLSPGAAATFLERLVRGMELVAGNVAPELVLDSLALAIPRGRAA